MSEYTNIPSGTRLFVNTIGNRLSNEGDRLPRSDSFPVLEKRVMHYDHRDHLAIMVTTEFGDRWVLVKEARLELNS